MDGIDPDRLILTVGLPRSGKTSWAQLVTLSRGWPIVSPDAIRSAILPDGYAFLPRMEPLVWAHAKLMVRALFRTGYRCVILDATNTTRKRRDEWDDPDWKRLYKLFTTPQEECIRRAIEGGKAELCGVIERMALQFDPLRDDEPQLIG